MHLRLATYEQRITRIAAVAALRREPEPTAPPLTPGKHAAIAAQRTTTTSTTASKRRTSRLSKRVRIQRRSRHAELDLAERLVPRLPALHVMVQVGHVTHSVNPTVPMEIDSVEWLFRRRRRCSRPRLRLLELRVQLKRVRFCWVLNSNR